MIREKVSNLAAQGILLVEDGNHGEYRPRPDEFTATGVAFVRAADMSSGTINFNDASKINGVARARIRKGIGKPGDVILSHKGTIGRIAVAPADSPEFVCSPQTTFWRSLDPTVLDQRYLRYTMQSPSFIRQLDTAKGNTDMAPYVSLTDQRAIVLELPGITEQQAIAEVLGALDDKIAANTRTHYILESLMATTYESGISTASVNKPVSEIAEFHNRRRVPLSSREREARVGTVPYYGAAGVLGYIDEPIFDHPLTLVGEDGSVAREDGRPVVQYIWGKSWVNNHAHALTGKTFSTEMLRFAISRSTVTHLVTGAVQPKISMRNLKNLIVEIPQDILPIDDKIMKMMSLWRALAEESRILTKTRDELLPLLMSGKIRVRDAERTVEEVT